MASIRPRKNKQGEITSYAIRVNRGRDTDGKQLKPYTMSWNRPDGWSDKAAQRELARVAGQFEADCSAGRILTKEQRAARVEAERQAAEKKQRELEQRVTLRKYANEVFMPRKSATFSENARASYTQTLERIFKYLGDMKLEEIRPYDIAGFLLALQTTERVQSSKDKKCVTTEKPLSFSTIIKHYTVLHGVLRMAYMDDLIPVNPMDKVERPKQRKGEQSAEVEALTVEEAKRLLVCLGKEPLQWQALIRLMLDTGCRRGEICGLKWSCVDFIENQITIENNLQYSSDKGVYNTSPKGGKARVVDVDENIMHLLKELKESRKLLDINGYCFLSADGTAMHPQTPTRYMEKFGQRYGFPGLHPHMLRHTAASIAITHGADIASVSAKLGHADKSTTLDMYTHADRASMERANEVYRATLYGEVKQA